ncbi:MAG: Gfo/Idh/MocA family protein [Promethearchaeota archaeon]
MKLKVGIIGTGFIVKKSHLPGFASSRKCIVKGLYDVKKEMAEVAKKDYFALLKKKKNPMLETALKETTVYEDIGAMIGDVDIVDICTPPRYHMTYLKQAVDAGKHVICEKPLARNWWGVNLNSGVVDDIKAKNLKFQLHTQGIWHPIVKCARDLIAEGIVGEVTRIRTLHQGADPKHTVNLPALWDRKHGGGGALVDIGPHAYAGMWYWLGGAGKWTPVSVKAELLEATIKERSIAGKPVSKVTVDDDAHVTITWKGENGNEVKGELEATWNRKDWLEGKAGKKLDLFYQIDGTKGSLTFPKVTFSLSKPFGIAVAIKFTSNDGQVKLYNFSIPKKGIEDLIFFDEFMDKVNDGTECRNDIEFSSEMLEVIGAAYLSKKEGRGVLLEEFKSYCKSVEKPGQEENAQVVSIINDLFEGF